MIFAGAPIFVPVPIRSHGNSADVTALGVVVIVYGVLALVRGFYVALEDESGWSERGGARSILLYVAIGLVWPVAFVRSLIRGAK